MPEIVHHFDVWHVAKGLKKLTALSKEKGCELLHVGSEKSVAKHVQNIHEHGDLYYACPHGHLEGTARHKKWFKPDVKAWRECLSQCL